RQVRARWRACRRRRQPVVLEQCRPCGGLQRRHGVEPSRQADRTHPAAGDLRQRVLRRAQAQPAVHGGQPIAVRGVHRHAGGLSRLTSIPRPGRLGAVTRMHRAAFFHSTEATMRTDLDLDRAEAIDAGLLDVLIRAGLILALVLLCYRVFAPFLVLMIWALILAVTLYPLQQAIARRIGHRQGLAATVIALLGIALIVTPTAVLMGSVGDSVHQLVSDVQNDTLQMPPPPDSVATWPLVGEKVHALWQQAHDDLPALVRSQQPKIGELAKEALAMVASIGGAILQFVAAFIIAAILMVFGEAGGRGSRAIFARVVGPHRGDAFT